MNTALFKRGLERIFLSCGFRRHGKCLLWEGENVAILIAFEKGFGSQWFITIGYWLSALGNEVPDRVERTHLSFRLERLLPDLREAILAAGALEEPGQEQAYGEFVALLPDKIVSLLKDLGTEDGLKTALASQRLNCGLVRKEARAYLAGHDQ